MDYFKHALLLKKNNPYRSWKIYETVYLSSLKFYAKKIYGSRFEDALDMAYSHILENFEDDKGELEHYATTVIGTINLGAYKHEINHEEVLEITNDQMSFSENSGDPLDKVIQDEDEKVSSEVDDCVAYLLPFFIMDYKFFKSMKSADRSLSYSELYRKFSDHTIKEAVDKLMSTYNKGMDEVSDLKRSLKFRNYAPDRYKKSIDSSVRYIDEAAGVIIYTKDRGKMDKTLYSVDIQDVLYDFVLKFYTGILNRDIGGLMVYCSLSGQIICDVEKLYEVLENELIGSILSKMQLIKVLKYERNKELVLVASKCLQNPGIIMNVLGNQFMVPFTIRTGKCVEA